MTIEKSLNNHTGVNLSGGVITDGQYVLSRKLKSVLSMILNQPKAIDSLTEALLDQIETLLDKAQADEQYRYVLFSKVFCADGDMKALARLGARSISKNSIRFP